MRLSPLLLATPALVLAYDGTTTFDTILVAHAEPTICPDPDVLNFTPDTDYIVCCRNSYPSATKTTAKGPGGKTIYACCRDGYTCTGAAAVMSDWNVDSNDDLEYLILASAPTPSSAPASTTKNTAAVTSFELGTVSLSGATPVVTSNGIVIYNYNNIDDKDTEINGDGNQNTDSDVSKNDGSLSSGAIAGITVACTIITTIVGVLGLWYARKRKRAGLDEM
ncbi:hypothetical protein BDW02DRAFT_65501 [Decorospora gaudefroyi]|uniref:Uncharacterized protein n=1 Tax=Decorospora gaudefroyi TaxID=184978 RepID=A0A6A5KHX6_9PLEO|nr:hypothetical protein BDW02DRAFT_65501 [Decorospora gaudefroyi]